MEAERRREVEERYADTTGIVAGGGGDWRQGEIPPQQSLKRGRSPDDDGEQERVSSQSSQLNLWLNPLRRLHVPVWILRRTACDFLPVQFVGCKSVV